MYEKNIFKRWPIACYFILVFSITWGGTFALGLEDFLRGVELDLIGAVPIAIIMLAGPLVTGIIMTWITGGQAGIRDLCRRIGKWKVGGRWYQALLIFPFMILAVQVPLSILFTPKLAPIFNPIGILGGLMAGVQEEIGWMGYAYPKMQQRFGILRAGIVLGVIHALWHAPADFIGNFNTMQMEWLPYFLGFSIFIVALRIIIVWIYENTGSLLLAMLVHAFSTGSLGILVPTANSSATWPVFYGVYAAGLWVIVVMILLRYREHMTGQHKSLLAQN
jgi:membrane protease YdiL (CAAX protease family)